MNWVDPNPQPNIGLPATRFEQPESSGFRGGTYLGRNFQRGQFVFGWEGDLNGTTNDETVPCSNPVFNCSFGSDWNASFRGRLGIARDRLLVFGTGGYSLADFEGFTQDTAIGLTFGDSHRMTGSAFGGGVEYAWSDRLRLRMEYLHKDFEKKVFRYDGPYLLKPRIDALTFGASISF
jgi:outer membrane immunogenic protein